jgi:site-specific DNA-methyltransferase (adenine-specific)
MKVTDKITITNEDNMLLMARYPDNYFDLAIVDPPYGLERFKKASTETTGVYAKRGSFKNKDGQNWNDIKPNIHYFEELFRVSKNQIIWGANNFNLPTTEYFCVWDKMQYMPNFASAEYAWVSMGLKAPAKVFRYGIHKENAIRKQSGGKIHQAQKPIKLYEWLLNSYANEGDKILDTHLGSGSIAIACHDYGFELTACELDKEYYDKAIQRIKNHTNQQKLF